MDFLRFDFIIVPIGANFNEKLSRAGLYALLNPVDKSG
jgi:hypothetical protein